MNDAFITGVFSDAVSAHHLDQAGRASAGKAELGPLPATAVYLLYTLAVTWTLIIAYVTVSAIKKAKKSK